MPSWFPIVASSLLAFIPVIIWINLASGKTRERGIYIRTFLFGTFAVIPPFILMFLFERFPDLNIYSAINRDIEQVALAALITNIVVGIVEEIAKNSIVRIIDKRHPEYIQKIGDALRLSICAGLGFSFAENIFYLYRIWILPEYSVSDYFSTFIFRSVFTMCGHMVFSGIFGYYFGLGKFSADLTQYARFEGSRMRFVRFLSRITGQMNFQIVRDLSTIHGLLLAMFLHGLFNAYLDIEYKLPSILIVAISAAYIVYLLQTQSAHLMFSIGRRKPSTIAPSDEDIVLELVGMWTKEGKLKEVTEICDRLLLRDPDNNVVKLFRARAADNAELKSVYGALKNLFASEGHGEKFAGFSMHPDDAAATNKLSTQDEKVILELLENWYKSGNYAKALEVAGRLLSLNPQSSGAQLILEKAMDKDKLRAVFLTLSKLFSG